jgi:Fe-S-cluster containining protein
MLDVDKVSPFPCTGCSACCHKLGDIHRAASQAPEGSIVRQAADEFPHSWDETGTCRMLENGLCSIYDERPLMCDVRRLAVACHNAGECDIKQLYTLNAIICNCFITEYGLDKKFMVDPLQFELWEFKEEL